ncbi:iron-sulfur cluster insertion protein ErpA [Blastochloris sulfoviridis]|uniref:Iron-sulfur cluster insertion protein ErpA n=1 Tax=Blastochloris sulfoviridis TaxID=50712 RepID=A0A5M6I1G9_9HYPH|nr:iron-sulfur cluster insertion protein ErpA [Blastochloris sulfoviridis]KAA5602016.1 iron-sulfur cluster insertion protein ErpA [Blastochloris sulfoviridis]
MATGITVTPRAAKRILKVLASEPAGSVLRVSVEGGGCTGFQYTFACDQKKAADDIVIEQDGAVVVIDPISLQYMNGSNLDFVEDLIGSAFRVDNPNATAKCGCGTSFSI